LIKVSGSKNNKTFLVLNRKDNGTVEPNDVRLILPSSTIRSGTNCTAKT